MAQILAGLYCVNVLLLSDDKPFSESIFTKVHGAI